MEQSQLIKQEEVQMPLVEEITQTPNKIKLLIPLIPLTLQIPQINNRIRHKMVIKHKLRMINLNKYQIVLQINHQLQKMALIQILHP